MNFLSLFARNLRHGPYTEPFPFAPPTPAPKRLRGRIVFDPKFCEGCLLCEKLCPSGRDPLRPHARRPQFRLLARDLRVLRYVRVLLPERSDPSDQRLAPRASRGGEIYARRARADPQPDMRRMRRQGPRHRAQRRQGASSALAPKNTLELARALSKMPQQVSQDQGEAVMTRLPADVEARLAAAAPTGIEYSVDDLRFRRRHRVVRPGEPRGASIRWQDAARARRAAGDGVGDAAAGAGRGRRKRRG